MHVNSLNEAVIPDSYEPATPVGRKAVKKRKVLRPTLGLEAPANLKEIDDAEEISSRNLHRFAEQATKFGSPHVSPERRKSMQTNAGMTNAQIVEHITNCLKLSAENKINLKNAFNLHLIDVMGSVINKDAETNFQTAGSTLDASAKIYAYRVDCVHQETYKIAGGLGRSDKANKKHGGDDDIADDNAEVPRQQLPKEEPVSKKRKKKVIKGSCIETNEKVLNMAGNEVKFESDELFENVRSSFDEGSAMGLFSNTLHTINDSSKLILHCLCDIPVMQKISSEPIDVSDLLSALPVLSDTHGESCCPPLKEFEFCNWSSEDDDDTTLCEPFAKEPQGEYAARVTVNAADERNTFVNVNNDPPNADTLASIGFGLEEESPELDSVGGDNDDEAHAECVPKFPSLEVVAKSLATRDLEYSYFDQDVLSTYLGPNHWKTKFIKRETPSENGGDSQENNNNDRKMKRPKVAAKRKTDERVNIDEDIQFEKIFREIKGKATTTLAKGTLEKYTEQQHCLDPTAEFKPNSFKRLFLKPDLKIQQKLKWSPDQSKNDEVGEYDLDNPMDRQNFCPDANLEEEGDAYGGGDVGGDLFGGDISFGEVPDYTSTPAGGDNVENSVAGPSSSCAAADGDENGDFTMKNDATLLEQPYKVNKIDINYARQAKRIDVRRVKQCIWQILARDDKQKDQRSPAELPSKLTVENQFSELCKELPKVVPSNAADSLSVHTVLTILLHMCNEKNLALKNSDDFSDVQIWQD